MPVVATLSRNEIASIFKIHNKDVKIHFLMEPKNLKKLNRYWLWEYGRYQSLLARKVKRVMWSKSFSSNIDLVFQEDSL